MPSVELSSKLSISVSVKELEPGLGLGETDELGERLALGLREALGEREADGEREAEGDSDALGDSEAEGEIPDGTYSTSAQTSVMLGLLAWVAPRCRPSCRSALIPETVKGLLVSST